MALHDWLTAGPQPVAAEVSAVIAVPNRERPRKTAKTARTATATRSNRPTKTAKPQLPQPQPISPTVAHYAAVRFRMSADSPPCPFGG